jgi:hypothetical protein
MSSAGQQIIGTLRRIQLDLLQYEVNQIKACQGNLLQQFQPTDDQSFSEPDFAEAIAHNHPVDKRSVDVDRQIRQEMKSRGLTYEEAYMYLNPKF